MVCINSKRLILAVLFALLLSSGSALADQKYSVHKGDTLALIARKTGVNVTTLKKINNLNGNNLKVNQKLLIPSAGEKQATVKTKATPKKRSEFYAVRKGDTLSKISLKTGVSVDELRGINKISSNRLKIGRKLALVRKQEPLAAPANAVSGEIATEHNSEGDKPDGKQASRDLSKLSDIQMADDDPIIDYGTQKTLGEWTSPNEQQMLVKVALAFLDAPYRFGGSSVRGIDCSGFVKKIYSLFGINLPRTAAEQSHTGIEVAKSSLTEGDLIFFNKKNRIGHVGIYIGGNKFVHAASTNKGVRIDSLDSPYYKNHYKRAVRLKTIENAVTSGLSSSSENSLSSEASLTEAHRKNNGQHTY
jgi:cell wall-associated NlpC family hydrolase